MADLRDPESLLAPGMLALCQDAQRLCATYPAPALEKTGSWHPGPWDLGPASAWLRDGMPQLVT
jgi:hypothetical protein